LEGQEAGNTSRETMPREYHIAAVGGSKDDEVSVDLGDVLNALGAQDWELATAVPLKDSDTLLLILSRGEDGRRCVRASTTLCQARYWPGARARRRSMTSSIAQGSHLRHSPPGSRHSNRPVLEQAMGRRR
jgi:hypothetical protein